MAHSHSGHSDTVSSSNSFTETNQALAKGFWYGIAGITGSLLVVHVVHECQVRHRLRKCRASFVRFPTKPSNAIQQLWATLTAVAREMSHPQLLFRSKALGWMTPPPLGRLIVLLVYWGVIIGMMVDKVLMKDAMFWERIGYRNAWVTIMQLPLLFMLAAKSNIIALLIGSSYERLNWFHRWVARAIFVTASVHGWHFWTQWMRADFVEFQMEMMPRTKYGMGAWGVLLWMNLTGLAPMRRLCYEVFVAQHIISAAVLLWLVYVHIPTDARYYVWWSIAALCLDRVLRTCHFIWRNLRVRRDGWSIGHKAQLLVQGDEITVVTIKDLKVSWRPGQHIHLWIPRIGRFETHPYTIASTLFSPETHFTDAQVVVRAHNGFSRRLYSHVSRNGGEVETVKAFILGPYGAPPRFDAFETLVLISASTGASFTLPILESALRTKAAICTTRIDFILVGKMLQDIQFYVEKVAALAVNASQLGIELRISIHTTQSKPGPTSEGLDAVSDRGSCGRREGPMAIERSRDGGKSTSTVDIEKQSPDFQVVRRGFNDDSRMVPTIQQLHGRPDLESMIRSPVEAAGGETSVVVCGGPSLVSSVRRCVSRLSDERAVHKGTGAQGIHLHVEEYSF